MSPIFDDKATQAAEAMKKEKIKASEFEGNGLLLQIKSVERTKSQYGAADDSPIVERGILEEGEQFLYKFMDTEGGERRLYSTSMPLFIGMQECQLNIGDWLSIKRTGKGKETKYKVEVVTAPEVAPKKVGHRGMDGVEYPEGPNPDDIPF